MLTYNNSPQTWDDMKKKYPMDRDEMDAQTYMLFVSDCFKLYESEGFAPIFYTPYTDYKNYNGQSFVIRGRCTSETHDLETLPQWNAEFKDGVIIPVAPEEVIVSEMSSPEQIRALKKVANTGTYEGSTDIGRGARFSGRDVPHPIKKEEPKKGDGLFESNSFSDMLKQVEEENRLKVEEENRLKHNRKILEESQEKEEECPKKSRRDDGLCR